MEGRYSSFQREPLGERKGTQTCLPAGRFFKIIKICYDEENDLSSSNFLIKSSPSYPDSYRDRVQYDATPSRQQSP